MLIFRDFLFQTRLGKNKYTCKSCYEWENEQTHPLTTPAPGTVGKIKIMIARTSFKSIIYIVKLGDTGVYLFLFFAQNIICRYSLEPSMF